jgi:hypothetical protein
MLSLKISVKLHSEVKFFYHKSSINLPLRICELVGVTNNFNPLFTSGLPALVMRKGYR